MTQIMQQNDHILQTVMINSSFQIMCYKLQHGKLKTPLHIMNPRAIYEKCRELITSFNRAGVGVSYKQLKSIEYI
jgi:hypothetical protein